VNPAHALAIAVAVLALAACGRRDTAPPEPVAPGARQPGDEAAAGADDIVLSGQGFEIIFHAAGYTGEAFEQPSMRIQAAAFELTDDGDYRIVDVNAIIYEQGQPSAVITAAQGEVNEAEGIAYLTGGVTLESGTLWLEMDDVEWQDKAQPPQAVSRSPVRLRGAETHLEASGMTLIPSTDTLVLTDVQGVWGQKGMQ
jgi:hypothetical protein